jgi:hypothetical protein
LPLLFFAALFLPALVVFFLFAAEVDYNQDKEDTECPMVSWDVAMKELNIMERAGVEYAMGDTAPPPLPC